MAGCRRCEQRTTKETNRRGGVTSSAVAEDNDCTLPVCQATSMPDSELAGLQQAEEGRVSPTAGMRTRESSPTATCYPLRNTQARTCRRVMRAGPGVRLATSLVKGKAKKTGFRRDVSRGEGQETEDRGVRAAARTKKTWRSPKQRQKRSVVRNRLLSTREI